MKITTLILPFFFVLLAWQVSAEDETSFSGGSKLDFEALLIEGQVKRPEVSVVTGDLDSEIEGLIRMREDFLDKMSLNLGEELQ
jgi:hypothetical protein